MNKRGVIGIISFILVVLLGVFTILAVTGVIPMTGIGITPAPEPGTTPDTSCDGLQSVSLLYDDKDKYEIGTDPNTNLTIYFKDGDGYTKTFADGATTAATVAVPTNSNFKAIAGNNAGVPTLAYFGELVEFSTVCSAIDVQTKLSNGVAPTSITVLNDDGVTKNSNSNADTLAASTDYIWEFSVRAPSRDCSARYGAIVALNYNSTAFTDFEAVNGCTETSNAIYIANANTTDGYNKWATFLVDGELCDGAKTTFTIKATTSSAWLNENNIIYQWLPRNYDLNANTFEVLGPQLYDEDNNRIWLGNSSGVLYTL